MSGMNIPFSAEQKDFLCKIASESEWGNAPIPLELFQSADISTLISITDRFKSRIVFTGRKDILFVPPTNDRMDFILMSKVGWAVLRIIEGQNSKEYVSVLWLPSGPCGEPYFPV